MVLHCLPTAPEQLSNSDYQSARVSLLHTQIKGIILNLKICKSPSKLYILDSQIGIQECNKWIIQNYEYKQSWVVTDYM